MRKTRGNETLLPGMSVEVKVWTNNNLPPFARRLLALQRSLHL